MSACGCRIFAVFDLSLPVAYKLNRLTCNAELRGAFAWTFLVLVLWTGLFLAIGSPFLPIQGAAWAVAFLWVTALVAGALVDRVSFSPVKYLEHH